MPTTAADLRAIKTFEDLIPYLEDKLGWPLQQYEFEDLTFEYSPAELGLKDEDAVKIKAIHQLRPLQDGQPWGIFFVEFERKKLPVVLLRRILSHLALKKRASANRAHAAAWQTSDLLFISAYGEERSDQREIAFAHFHQEGTELPTLRVLGWDGGDTPLKLTHVDTMLKEKLSWPDNSANHDAWRAAWSGAFRHRIGHVIRTADALAEALAALARRIRDAALLLLAHETESGTLRSLYKAFQTALIHDLSEADFADTYAQTITYGLLTAAISRTEMSDGAQGTALIAENIADIVPVTNPFLKEMLQTFLKVGGRKGGIDFDELGIQDVVELLRGEETDLPAVLRDFGNKTQGEDPVIHFYEHFLAAYDKKLKVQRGVFYTPKPVVGYIVRSVHELLQTEFGLADGLADTTTWAEMAQRNPDLTIPEGTDPDSPFVVILDPATGTATFLVEVVETIYRTMTAKWQKEGLTPAQRQTAWNEYVPRHLLPRLYGYELMMAPYAIAHMKMGLKLYETGYRFDSKERVHIYLTNALEPANNQLPLAGIIPALAHEAQAVNLIKRSQRYAVVIGNPPYAGHSWNLTPKLRKIVEPYRYVAGKPIVEKGALQLEKSIQDDYIKFFRHSQERIEQSGIGILGLVTSHGFLDNPFLRGMRYSIMTSFTDFSFIDLHGNALRHEKASDGSVDENVFDIRRTGAAISLLRKRSDENKKMWRFDVLGDRSSKYIWLNKSSIETTQFLPITPRPRDYLFIEQDSENLDEYELGYSIGKVMAVNSKGVVTGRDKFVLDFDVDPLSERMEAFVNPEHSDDELVTRFNLNPTAWWEVDKARRDMPPIHQFHDYIRPVLYRPFDVRHCFYHPAVLMSPRRPVMKHLDPGLDNYLLITSRMTKGESFQHITVAKGLAEAILLSSKTSNNAIIFPLYLYAANSEQEPPSLNFDSRRQPNFSSQFVGDLQGKLQLQIRDGRGDFVSCVGVEDVFFYILSILHSPMYRKRYSEPLTRDFPHIPMPSNPTLFRILSQLGEKIKTIHLVEFALEDEADAPAEWPRYPRLAQFSGGNRVIEKFPAANKAWQNGRVAINNSSGFTGVPEAVWNFHIGGYQVCHKWLKDRKGRALSDADIHHYAKIVTALNETIRLMAEIDAVIEEHGGWPIQ